MSPENPQASLLPEAHPARWVVFPGLVALLIPTLPNAIYFHVGDNPGFWIGEWVTSALLMALPLMFGCSLRTNLIILFPFALLTPGAAAFAWLTRMPPSVLALQLLREATREELATFLPQLWICGAAGLVVSLFYLALIRAPGTRAFGLGACSRFACAFLLVVVLAKDAILGHPEAAPRLLGYRLEKMLPHGPLLLLARLKLTGELSRDRSGLLTRYPVRQQPPHPENEVCVLVLGESARRGDLGLYAPALDSTPLLQARRDLIVFQEAATCGTVTDTAVPAILTGRLPEAGNMAAVDRLGLVEAFRLAGFHTVWISNQEVDANSLSVLSAFTASAHEKIDLTGSDRTDAGSAHGSRFDGALLDPLARILQTHTGKLFILVHLIGSHQPYLLRYPPEFEHWPVDAQAKKSLRTWIAPYDHRQQTAINHTRLNSVRYTDWVLERILSIVAGTGRMATVAYLSDHGENLPDAPVLPSLHGTVTRDVIDIPLFFWASEEMRTRQKARFDALAANAGRPVSTIDLFATLCSLFDLETSEADPATNLASPDYRERELRVLNMDHRIYVVPR